MNPDNWIFAKKFYASFTIKFYNKYFAGYFPITNLFFIKSNRLKCSIRFYRNCRATTNYIQLFHHSRFLKCPNKPAIWWSFSMFPIIKYITMITYNMIFIQIPLCFIFPFSNKFLFSNRFNVISVRILHLRLFPSSNFSLFCLPFT